jgi:hypothetical protein
METAQKLAVLQNTYAAALAETVNTYAKQGTLDAVVAAKAARQEQTAAAMLAMFGITEPTAVLTVLADVFGCANWQVQATQTGFTAKASACKLCALSKRMGGANPCQGWCLDPMAAMVRNLDGRNTFTVRHTLMDSDACEVEVTVAQHKEICAG